MIIISLRLSTKCGEHPVQKR